MANWTNRHVFTDEETRRAGEATAKKMTREQRVARARKGIEAYREKLRLLKAAKEQGV